ncbi:MAG TPA: vanadium-dependent haloperoxidase [Terriglobia bacterium]|nr:vanadium-dependent haloperoxidase [Terriglobia bacterium]
MAKKGKKEIDANGASRRKFLGKAGGMTAAVAAASAGLPSLLSAKENTRVEVLLQKARRQAATHTRRSFASTGSNAVGGPERRIQAFRVRLIAALDNLRAGDVPQINNGDEALYASENYIGNYSKGLPHDSNGLVAATDYQKFLTAATTGKQSDWEAVPRGGTVPQVNPQSGLIFNLEGADNAAVTLPPAPAFASAQRAGEMVENYWLALLRDVPFTSYATDPTAAAAIADLNKLSDYRGPLPVTAQNLMRGNTPGDLVGPYVSQFLMMNLSGIGTLQDEGEDGGLGTAPANTYTQYAPGVDYMTDGASWLAVQNGQCTAPNNCRSQFFTFGPNQFDNPGYLFNGRGLSSLVHVDELYQHFFFAAAEMLAAGFPPNPGNPYSATLTPNEVGFVTWGGPHFTGLIAEVAYRAAQAVWYQKWYVHRPLRPEEYSGRVQNTIVDKLGFPVHPDVLNAAATAAIFSAHGTYYLPMAYPEGCPWHPSYGSGHMTVAAASCTMLKALFDETASFVNQGLTPVFSSDGVTLSNYTGSDVGSITVGTEINKLASNIGIARDTAGMHWHSDYFQSLFLGEAVACRLLQDIVNTTNEDGSFQFTGFNGNSIVIQRH